MNRRHFGWALFLLVGCGGRAEDVGPAADAGKEEHDAKSTSHEDDASHRADSHVSTATRDAGGSDKAEASTTRADASSAPEASASNLCAPGGSGRLLACSNGCADSLFSDVQLEDDFGAGSAYSQLWTGTYIAPTLDSAGLQFGPHAASPDWWNTYSPTATNESDFGDVMFCVRFTFSTSAAAVAISDAGTYADAFQISLRGGSEGMVLGVGGVSETVSLSTEVDSDDTWVTHASAPLDFSVGMHTMELALYGVGQSFYAEAKEVDSGTVVPLRTTYGLPATGSAQMLGWQLPQALTVTRVAIGTPSPASAARIMAP